MKKKLLLVMKKYWVLVIVSGALLVGNIFGLSNIESVFLGAIICIAVILLKEERKREELEWRVDEILDGAEKIYPTYEKILEMTKDKSQKIFFERYSTDLRVLLEEMINHEEKTGTFAKTAKGKIKPEIQIILNVFDKEKSKETVSYFDKIDRLLADHKDSETSLLSEAIFAKFASDLYELHKK